MFYSLLICCVDIFLSLCAFVIYSEYLLIPPISKLTTAATHIPIVAIHALIVLGSAMWIIQNLISISALIKERRAERA